MLGHFQNLSHEGPSHIIWTIYMSYIKWPLKIHMSVAWNIITWVWTHFSCTYEDFIIFCFDDNEPIRASSYTRTLPSSFRIFVKDPVITTLSFSTKMVDAKRPRLNPQKIRPDHIYHIIWCIWYDRYDMINGIR